MRRLLSLCSLVLALATPHVATAGELKLSMANGRVTLIADAVPVRTILQEWARLGQSRIVNGDKVQGPPLTLRLIDVPEEQALDIVLRSASGYLAAPRATTVSNASRFDRIVILATSRPTTTAPPPAPAQQPAPQPYPAQPAMQMPVGDDQDESDEPRPEDMPVQPQPGVAPRPGPIQVTPPDPNAPNAQPGQEQPPQLPLTSPRPGMIQPPQPQPQQPPPARPIP
jgi:hypothetical protein